jgi:hypothetical protein
MADRTTLASVAISSSYQQLLFVADTTGVPATSASPADSLIYSSGGKKAAFKIGFDQCSIPSGSHNFDVGSHNGTYGLKLGGTLVTASAAELNYNDVAAIGTTAASKSMVTDANGAIQFPDSSATTHRLDFGDSSDMVMYHDGSNAYIRNKTGALKIATESSGIAVTIGHTTSETTVADNLNTTGLIRVNDKTDGGLSVVKSAVIGDDLDLLSDSAILNMGAGKDFTITHDGTTGATLAGTPISINSTGDLTLDSSTDIILDADGADIIFKDAGTAIGKISNSSSDLVIENEVDAKDIIFKQYDGSEVCRMADDRRLYFFDKGGEYISSDGSDLTIAAGTAVNITADVLDLSDATKDVTLNSAVDAINFDSNTLSIDASNNRVGVGIAAPEAKLHILTGDASIAPSSDADEFVIEGSGHTGMSILGGASHSMTIAFGDSGDANIGQISYDHNNNAMNFVTATTQAMIIDSSQQVGIGTTSPDTMLEVSGSFAANGPSSTFVTMASGDTSPDVSGGNIFKSHTDGVTIDQFDGGICGQIITIISGGATVYDVTSSELNGGTTNITTAAGDVTMWVCESATDWHLLSWMDLSIDLSSGGF